MEVVDLAHPYSPDFPLYPGYDPTEVAARFSIETNGFFAQGWSFDEHTGTHVDAPAHFDASGTTADAIPPGDLVLALVVVDIREKVRADPEATLDPDDVLRWEKRHGALPDRSIVCALTGWDRHAASESAYLNRDASGAMRFPGFSADTSELLLERTGVVAIGLDAPSLDHGSSTEFPVHRTWLGVGGRYGIENLTRLDAVPPLGAELVVGLPPWRDGSGGPCRPLALLRRTHRSVEA